MVYLRDIRFFMVSAYYVATNLHPNKVFLHDMPQGTYRNVGQEKGTAVRQETRHRRASMPVLTYSGKIRTKQQVTGRGDNKMCRNRGRLNDDRKKHSVRTKTYRVENSSGLAQRTVANNLLEGGSVNSTICSLPCCMNLKGCVCMYVVEFSVFYRASTATFLPSTTRVIARGSELGTK